jgi:hypothetical protein
VPWVALVALVVIYSNIYPVYISRSSPTTSAIPRPFPVSSISMVRIRSLAHGAYILSLAAALPTNDPVNIATNSIEKRQHKEPAERAQAVVNTFKLSWEGYYKYAFPNDELKPVTNGFSNSRSDISSLASESKHSQSDATIEINGAPQLSTHYPPLLSWARRR